MSQKNIDFGTFPDDPSADPIRAAFQKTQENFTELFRNQVTTGVSSVNKTPGAGIAVNKPTGDVIISANIACVKVFSSSMTLSLLNGTPCSFVTLTQSSSQTLNIELPANINTLTTGVTNISLSGNITAANISSTGLLSATGNIQGGNLRTTGILSVGGNANVGNIGATNAVFTNVSGNGAQLTNITGASVTGTVANATYATSAGSATTAGTVTTASQPNITSIGTLTSLSVSGNSNVGNLRTAGLVSATGNVTGAFFIGNGSLLTGIADPTTIQNGNSNVVVAANSNVTVSVGGNSNIVTVSSSGLTLGSGNGGTFSGANLISANFFQGNGSLLTGISAGSSNTAQTVTNAAQPNITSVGTLTTLSVSGNSNIGNIGTAGLVTATGNIQGGNLRTSGILSVGGNANVGNLGATNGVFTNISGNGASLTSLPGGNISGQVANALVTGTVYTNAQPNITSVGTLTSLSVSGNVTANYFFGDGSQLTGVAAGSSNTAQTVTTNAQPNITSVGTLTSLSVSGNANIGNIGTAGLITATGNIQGGNLRTAGILSVGGNANVGNIGAINGVFTSISGNGAGLTSLPAANISGQVANALVAGTLYTNAQPNITSLGTLSSLSVSGNANIGNIGTAGLITATGNIIGGNFFVGTPIVPSSSRIQVAGEISMLQGGSQSLGFNTAWNTGVSNWQYGSNGYAAAARFDSGVGKLQFWTSTNFGAASANADIAARLTIDNNGNVGIANASPTHTLSITGTLNLSGNANVGNLGTTGIFATTLSSTGNANVGNLGFSTGIITGTGNISAGFFIGNGSQLTGVAATTAATVTTAAQPNITSVGTLTSLSVSGTANLGASINMNASGGAILTGPGLAGSGTGGLLRMISAANVAYIQSGIYNTSNSAAPLAFTTMLNGREWMRLDENGNVGINITAPTSKLHANGTSNITGAAVFGSTISVAGNANVANIGAGEGVFTGNVSLGSGTGGSLTGANLVSANFIAGTLTTSSQPNITSLGTLTSLSVSGNANIGNIGTAGLITATGAITSNANITSGNGYFVSANANLGYFLNVSGNSVGKLFYNQGAVKVEAIDATSNVQIAANGTARLSVFANGLTSVNGPFSVSGNANVGNLGTSGLITSSGNITGNNVVTTRYLINSIQTGITAAGTTQGAATVLGNTINIVSTITSGANGVVLPTAIPGLTIYITNTTANSLNVFPASGAAIGTAGTNNAFLQTGNSTIHYLAASTTQWYTVGATYS